MYGDAFTGESDDTFDDVFVAAACVELRVLEDNNFAAPRDIFFVLQHGPGDGQAIDDQAVAGVKGRFHAWSQYVKAAKNIGVDHERTNKYADDEDYDAERIFNIGMTSEK